MAADGKSYMGGMLRPSANKIRRGSSSGRAYAFAHSGDAALGPVLKDFLDKGADDFNRPVIVYAGSEKPSMRSLVVFGVGTDEPEVRFYDEDFLWVPERADVFSALGSGDALAIGAMAMGASAIEAVRVAIQHSSGSGYPIYWVNIATGEEGVVHG